MNTVKVAPLLPVYGAGETKTDPSLVSNLVNDLPPWKYSFRGVLFGADDDSDEEIYQEFMSSENSCLIHGGVTILLTLLTCISMVKTAFSDYSFEYKVLCYQAAFLMIPLWLYLYSVVQKKYPEKFRPLCIDILYLGDALVLTFPVVRGIAIYGMAAACDFNLAPQSSCGEVRVLGMLMRYMAGALLFPIVVKCRHLMAVLLSIVIEISFVSLVVSMRAPGMDNALAIAVMFIIQIIVVCDCDHSRRIYLLLVESRATLHNKIMAENDNVVMEMQSTELRFLIANVAHDLKTPLQALSYELELMKGQVSENNTESILLLESICSFMLMTINRALDYTKVTSGIKLKPSLETVAVDEVLEWVKMCVTRTAIAEKAVSIVVEPFPENMCNFIITDKQWLMENLLCLISNAQKFTAHGSIRIKYSAIDNSSGVDCKERGVGGTTVKESGLNSSRTTITRTRSRSDSEEVTSPPTMVMVEVIDDGIGISTEMQSTLFQPFKQAMRRAGGTGLGIYSLSKRVECMGGQCGVSSREDGQSGARFWFTLPYRPDEESASTRPWVKAKPWATSQRIAEETFTCESPRDSVCRRCSVQENLMDNEEKKTLPKKDIKIMLVEDSLMIQKTCSRSFLREGITLDIANNGLECVERVFEAPNQYSILLMDVNMPLMDGLEATIRIREWERTGRSSGIGEDRGKSVGMNVPPKKKMLIIGVSANSDNESRQEALDAGMDRFITKPLKMEEFRDCLVDFQLNFDNFKN